MTRALVLTTQGTESWTQTALKGWLSVQISDVQSLSTSLAAKADLASGYLVTSQLPGFIGDVTCPIGSRTFTIPVGSVGLSKLAPQATGTLLGNVSGSAASPVALTAAQTKAMLAISYADVGGLNPIAQSGDSQYLTGTLPATIMPAFTGDVAVTLNSTVTTINTKAVSLAKMADFPAQAMIGNPALSSGVPQYLSPVQVKSLLAIAPSDVVGIATVAITGSYNDLSNKPTIPAAQVNADWNAVSGVSQILNKPALATVAFTGAAADLTGTLAAARLPAMTGGDVVSSVGSSVLSIQTGVVTLSKLATISGLTLLGNASGSSATPAALTGAQAIGLLPAFQTTVAGLVPAPGAVAGKYLKDDGTWGPAVVSGGLLAANNLSDVQSTATALANLNGASLQQAMLYSIIFG